MQMKEDWNLDQMGGGDVMGGGGKNGWSYSFGKWPVQVQQQQPQPQALQQDWATNNDPPPQRHSCSPSPHPHSRRSSTKSREIFIPPAPENDWVNFNYAPVSFRPQSRNPTPDPVNGWHWVGAEPVIVRRWRMHQKGSDWWLCHLYHCGCCSVGRAFLVVWVGC